MQIACKFFVSLLFESTPMKSTSITVSLDTRRSKSDGTYPLILRLTHNRKTTSIKTGIHLKKEDWDENNRVVKKSYKGTINVTRLNNEIQKKKAEALDDILKLGEKSKPASVSDLKRKIDRSSSSHSFYEFGEKLIKELITSERVGTARTYKQVMNFLKTFNKGKPIEKNKGGNPKTTKFKEEKFFDLSFEEIDYNFLMKLENYHLSSGNELNGLAFNMRTIRSIYNKAAKADLVDRSQYPFADYKIKTKPTKKRALDKESLSKIIALYLPQEHTCFNARNYFIASYMMYGMSFADMAFLQKTDIIQGRIYYRRKKTSMLYDIKVSDKLESIFSFYAQQNPSSKYVFPILKRKDALGKQKDILSAIQQFNKNLSVIAEMCGIKQRLTSYVSRHSFATNAMMINIPINAISSMLGHKSLKTTEIYLKSLPSNVLDNYNEQILQFE